MDSRKISTLPQFMLYCGLVTCLNSISIGYVIGSPNIPEESIRGINGACGSEPYTIQGGFPNCIEFSDLIWGFAVGSFCIGACAGGLIGGSIQSRFGRIKTLLLANFVMVLGSVILGLTYHQAQFIAGRIVVGLACGLGFVVVPTYLGEISTVKGRGTLGACHQLFLVIGILISNLVGLGWSSPPGWRIVFVLNAAPSILQCFLLPSLVESPKFLVSQGRLDEAQASLQRLRGSHADMDITLEFGEMAASSLVDETPEKSEKDVESVSGDKSNNQEPYSIIELLKSECRGLALMGAFLHFLQQATGINGLVYYSTSFLTKVFGSENSKYLTIGISCCNLITTIVSVLIIGRFNRKTLVMTSFTGLTISSVLLLAGAYANIGILVAIAVFLYIATFAIALGPIPWLLIPELLPAYAISAGSSVATFTNMGTNFLIGLVFPSMAKGMGNATFILFGAINFFGVFFTWYVLPETKDRSIEDIMREKGVAPRPKK
ncbi:hypothetical protein BGZ76_003395 [Entomortierella beljakovae]|nr:hypothetical protein BGZ76_003395 [Entomortierella beljakovae]